MCSLITSAPPLLLSTSQSSRPSIEWAAVPKMILFLGKREMTWSNRTKRNVVGTMVSYLVVEMI